MLFLGPIYNLISNTYSTRINHFALIKLSFLALDKTIFYFLIFVICRLIWLLSIRHRRSLLSEASLWILAFYTIYILMFTTFRQSYFPWQLSFHFNRPISDANFVFLKETWKMVYAQSEVDFFYNSVGNILCFIPLGLLTPIVFYKKQSFIKILTGGILFSFMIETLQFLLVTGVSDIDDIFFNTIGLLIGYMLFLILKKIYNNFLH